MDASAKNSTIGSRRGPVERLSNMELIATSIGAIGAFQDVKKVKSLDNHSEEFVAEKRLQEEDALFVKQVLYGYERYKKMLKVTVSALYAKHAGETNIGDKMMYTVFAYLILIRLDELGWPALERLMLSHDQRTMVVFSKFLFSRENLENWMAPEWRKIYDEAYVAELVDGVMQWEGSVSQLIAYLDEKVYMIKAAVPEGEEEEEEANAFQSTVPRPFNLTKPKPRMVPEPEELQDNEPFVAAAVPKFPKVPQIQKDVDAAILKNRAAMKGKYSDKEHFKFATHSLRGAKGVAGGTQKVTKSTAFEVLKAKTAAAEEEENRYIAVQPKEVPAAPTEPIKMTAAAVLREDAMYQKKQEQEAAAIEKYESELRDASEYESWKARMEVAENDEKLKEVARRRIEMQLADEQAILARRIKQQQNQQVAASIREEGIHLQQHLAAEELEETLTKRMLVEDVNESKKGVWAALAKIPAKNKKVGEAVRREAKLREAEAEEEREKFLVQRRDLIMQIRALEQVPVQTVTRFDPTVVGGDSTFLDEMSLSELGERLQMEKRHQQAQVVVKRKEISAARREREDDLARRAERLVRIREQSALDAEERRKVKYAKEAVEKKRVAIEDDALALELQSKLEQTRALRQAADETLVRELKANNLKKKFLNADMEKVEETKFRELNMAAERAISVRQELRKVAQRDYEEVRSTEVQQRDILQKQDAVEKKETSVAYDVRVATMREDSAALDEAAEAYVKTAVALEQTRAALSKSGREQLLPYATNMTKSEQNKSKKWEQTQRSASQKMRTGKTATYDEVVASNEGKVLPMGEQTMNDALAAAAPAAQYEPAPAVDEAAPAVVEAK